MTDELKARVIEHMERICGDLPDPWMRKDTKLLLSDLAADTVTPDAIERAHKLVEEWFALAMRTPGPFRDNLPDLESRIAKELSVYLGNQKESNHA